MRMSEQTKRVYNFHDVDHSMICYWKHREADYWMIRFPDIGYGDLVGDLSGHTVKEHEDGTITVTPSIRTWNDRHQRHGFLTKGVWNEV